MGKLRPGKIGLPYKFLYPRPGVQGSELLIDHDQARKVEALTDAKAGHGGSRRAQIAPDAVSELG
jgi:hypothetical protein